MVTMIASVIVLRERITILMLLGAALILAGVMIADGTVRPGPQLEENEHGQE